MGKKKFRINNWNIKIDEIEITKETEHSIWIKDYGLERKNTHSNMHFDTWDDAYAYLLGRETGYVKSAQYKLETATERFEKVRAML